MKVKTLESMETLTERFTYSDSEAAQQFVGVKLDGVSISIEELVKCANQLSSALESRGTYFTTKGKAH